MTDFSAYFRTFELEGTPGCARDYVEVRDGTNVNNVLGRYCGSTIPNNITIAKSMKIKFRSDAANSFAGFTAQFSTRKLIGCYIGCCLMIGCYIGFSLLIGCYIGFSLMFSVCF